jgi:hypothetical protein
MAEPEPTGTAPVTPPVEPTTVMTAPVTPQTPQEPEPPTPAPPAGGGKTLEQLSQDVEEYARLAQEASDRAARAEHDALLQRNIIEQLGLQKGQQQEEAPLDLGVTDDEYLTNPVKASAKITSKIVESYFAKERQERDKERVSQYVESARSAYETGKATALKANPTLYRGIQADIEREVLNNVQASLKAGQPVDAAVLSNPRYWEAAALAYRVMNGEDVSKYYTKTHNPMSPVHQETPTAGGPPQDVVTLSEEERYTARAWGITDEQYMAQKKRSLEEKARLAR